MDIVKDSEKVVTNKYVLWGAAGVAALFIGWTVYQNNLASQASASSTGDSTANDLASQTPIVLTSNGQVAADTSSTGDSNTQALLNLETTNAGDNFATAIAQINSNTVLGLAGAQTDQLAIQSSNFATTSQILSTASSLFQKGFNAIVGSVTAPDGSVSSINLAAATTGKGSGPNNLLTSFVNSTAYSAFAPSSPSSTSLATSAPALNASNVTTTAGLSAISAQIGTLDHAGLISNA
jgi:hypothetical protein